MLIRVRSNVGVWRVDNLDANTSTIGDVLSGIAQTRPHVVYEKPLSSDQACTQPYNDPSLTLASLNLKHGSLIYCRVDPSTCADVTPKTDTSAAEGSTEGTSDGAAASASNTNMKRIIDKDGSIKLVPSTEIRNDKDDRGFRKGMLPLRDMKMAWTLNEFVALDSQFTFKIKRQESAVCNQVSLDSPSVHGFQSYLQQFQFARKRIGYMYGKFVDTDDDDGKKRKAVVEAIYEPPQEVDSEAAEGFVLLEDPMEETVEQIAQMCGLTKVGWIFGHPPGRGETKTDGGNGGGGDGGGYVLSNAEIIMAAELQLEAAGGVEETPFVTVKVTRGNDGNVSVEAFQVSQQCMEMVAEEALEIGADPGKCVINETFTAIQEGKESKTVDNNFFLTVVPIVQHTSDMFVSQFPRLNRDIDERTPSHDELKKQLSKSGTAGWTFVDLLSDFNLLLYLSKFLDVNADYPKITQSVVNRDVPLDDGYKIIIASMAGIDGAY